MKKVIVILIIVLIGGFVATKVNWPQFDTKKPVETTKETVDLGKMREISEEEKNTTSSEMANTKKIRTTHSGLPVTNTKGNTFEKAKTKLKNIYNDQTQ